jgi:hypothetical protein
MLIPLSKEQSIKLKKAYRFKGFLVPSLFQADALIKERDINNIFIA